MEFVTKLNKSEAQEDSDKKQQFAIMQRLSSHLILHTLRTEALDLVYVGKLVELEKSALF